MDMYDYGDAVTFVFIAVWAGLGFFFFFELGDFLARSSIPILFRALLNSILGVFFGTAVFVFLVKLRSETR